MLVFPTKVRLENSTCSVNMMAEEKYNPKGLICQMVMSKYAGKIVDKQFWWSKVRKGCFCQITKRQNAVSGHEESIHE